MEHGMNCSGRNPLSEDGCTCGLGWRIKLQTEQEMHNAWRKRAEEAEASLAEKEGQLCAMRSAAALATNHLHASNETKEKVYSQVKAALSSASPCPHESRVKELEGKYHLMDEAHKTMSLAYDMAFNASQKAESRVRQLEEAVEWAAEWLLKNVLYNKESFVAKLRRRAKEGR